MRHATRKAEIEEVQLKEFENFTKEHAEKAAALEDELETLAQQLETKHQDELSELKEKVKKESVRPKFSSELLRLRKQQETLAKMENFAEAHKIKLQADAYETNEAENTKKDRKTAVAKREGLLLDRHATELDVMKTKIAAKREVFTKQQQDELQRLLKKFHNAIAELDMNQNLELVKKGTTAVTPLKLDAAQNLRKTFSESPYAPLSSRSPSTPKHPATPKTQNSSTTSKVSPNLSTKISSTSHNLVNSNPLNSPKSSSSSSSSSQKSHSTSKKPPSSSSPLSARKKSPYSTPI